MQDFRDGPHCDCLEPEARHDQFRTWRALPCDETEGRFADVTILECCDCGRLWLRYAVEYEGFPGSGRWARGMIEAAAAQEIRPEESARFIVELPSYVYGGSYFGSAGIGSGAIYWGA